MNGLHPKELTGLEEPCSGNIGVMWSWPGDSAADTCDWIVRVLGQEEPKSWCRSFSLFSTQGHDRSKSGRMWLRGGCLSVGPLRLNVAIRWKPEWHPMDRGLRLKVEDKKAQHIQEELCGGSV
jgi:hypothetical protein